MVTVETGPPGIPPLAGIVSLGPVVSWQVVPSRTNACSTGARSMSDSCQFIPRSPLGGSRARGGWRGGGGPAPPPGGGKPPRGPRRPPPPPAAPVPPPLLVKTPPPPPPLGG